jgi:hypothetical protein
MATYTMELREYIEQATQDDDTLSIRDKIETGRTKLFDFDYPIFDENYRKDFETHFIRNFYTREIGFETEGLFKFYLENWLLINMPYWNNMFKSELITFDPLTNTKVDATKNKTKTNTTHQESVTDGTNNSTTTQDGNGTLTEDNFNRQIDADTPDTRLTLTTNDGQGILEYASNIKEDNENNSKNSTTHNTGSLDETSHASSTNDLTVNETEDETDSSEGKIGVQTYSQMLQEFRETFLRIEKSIFSEMSKELFMLVY